MSRQQTRRPKRGTKPLNLKHYSSARLRSLLRRIDIELCVLNTRIANAPEKTYRAVDAAELAALQRSSAAARVLLAALDKGLVKFATAHPELTAFQTRVNGARMVGTN